MSWLILDGLKSGKLYSAWKSYYLLYAEKYLINICEQETFFL